MGRESLFVDLLAHTPQAEAVVAMGARLCYSAADVAALSQSVKKADQSAFLQKLADMGHLSPVEHVSFTFGIQGVSRALLAQITRHRIASFSVQSQRYVSQTGGGSDSDGFSYIVPPAIADLGEEALDRYDSQMKQMSAWYDEWTTLLGSEGKEDARFVLPNACETRIVMTMNARELRHFLQVRCCERAQWEIRALAWAILGHLLRVAPEIFSFAGPDCLKGACGEGNMSCGRKSEIAARHASLEAVVKEQGQSEDFASIISKWAVECL